MSKTTYALVSVVTAISFLVPLSAFADSINVNFESSTYTVGSISGQDGWSNAVNPSYDQGIVSSPVISGSQSFRISDAVTSGSFGDWVFAKPLADSVGETTATAGTFSVGTKQTHFEVQFDLAAVVPNAQQPDLHISVSPDRGDGSRMSYLRFEDQANGIHVFFDDVTDSGPVGTVATFNDSDIATLDRTVFHTIKLTLDTLDGPSNDVVKVYVDGVLKKTGTSWENYYRFDPEASAEQSPRIVKTVIIQARGTATSADLGKGFLIDNLSLLSGPTPASTGSIEITKYACPDGTVVTRSANGVGETVPAGCVLQPGMTFGYVHGSQTDANSPYPELSAPLTAGGTTNGSGVLTIPNLPADGRYLIVETNSSNQQLAAGDILGLYCTGDGDTSGTNDNQELTFVPANGTTKCIAYNKAPPPVCNTNATQTIVSDATTQYSSSNSTVLSGIPSVWASISGASWIWGTNGASDNTTVPTTEDFTRTFNITGTPTSASIDLSADNGYVLIVNGTTVDTKNTDPADEFNYQSVHTYNILPYVHSGSNTLEIDVTNFGRPGTTFASNPGGLIYSLTVNNNECVTPPPPPPISPEVHIFKYVDGVQATAANTNNATFPMETTFNSPNLGSVVNVPFTLSPTGWGSIDSAYEASFVGSNAGADYEADEVLGGPVVGDSCDGTHTFGLVGYTTGETLADAQSGTPSVTPLPSFTNLQSDKYVIVWNKTCPIKGSLVVTKDSIGGNGTFSFTGNNGIGTFQITTTGNTGSQTLTNLTPGTYNITEATPSKGWTMTDNECLAIKVSASDVPAQCVITNTSNKLLGEIRGTKYEDRDGDGTLKDGDHHRLAGWTIYIDTNNNGSLDTGEPSTITDSHGNYRFVGLVAGTYHVREVGQSGWIQTVPASGKYDITLTAGKISKKDNFGNFKLGTISGMKFNDLNGNKHKDSGEVGLAGWTIDLMKVGSPTVIASTVTDANGNYSFTDIGPGTYQVKEEQQSGWIETTKDPKSIKMFSGEVSKNNDFGNHYGPMTHGRGHDWGWNSGNELSFNSGHQN